MPDSQSRTARRTDAPPVPMPAATVVLMRDGAEEGSSPEVLLVERHRNSVVGPGAFVFPGGVLEPSDLHPDLPSLSPQLTGEAAAESLGDGSSPREALGYFVAAIRETFEEALVLLTEPLDRVPEHQMLAEARARLNSGALTFADWLLEHGLLLATQRLVYFAHWITPEAVPQRFSARFFLVPVPRTVAVVPDGQEVMRHQWLQPREAIAMERRGDIHLMAPTIRNLELLSGFDTTHEAVAALRARPVEAIMPQMRVGSDGGRTVVFPWDADYRRSGS